MGRNRSTDPIGDALPLSTAASADGAEQRHVLPKDLRSAVRHLNDGELDRLYAATLDEMKRRNGLPPGEAVDSANLSPHSSPMPPTAKASKGRVDEVPLTRGQLNAVRAAFKAGITPATIARQFGISQSNVRKALATEKR
jgi:hypothetical protein